MFNYEFDVTPESKQDGLSLLADALDRFWNAALGATHPAQEAVANAVMAGMVEGVAAVSSRLREHAEQRTEAYAKLGRAAENHGLAWYDGVTGEMLFQPPAEVTAAAAVSKFLREVASDRVIVQTKETVDFGALPVPVAWRVKDFADGWILCHSAEQARLESEDCGNLVEPLFR